MTDQVKIAGNVEKRNFFNVTSVRIVLSGAWLGGNREAAATVAERRGVPRRRPDRTLRMVAVTRYMSQKQTPLPFTASGQTEPANWPMSSRYAVGESDRADISLRTPAGGNIVELLNC